MKRSDVLGAVEWAGTLGAAGLWMIFGIRQDYPGAGLFLIAPSQWILWAGTGLILVGLFARGMRTGHMIPSSLFDGPLLLFLIGGFVGLACAYDPDLGLLKLHYLLSAVSITYLLAAAGSEGLQRFAMGLTLAGAGLALYWTTQHDYAAEPVKLDLLNQLGLALNSVVPDLGVAFTKPNANVIAAVLGLVLPFNLALLTALKDTERQAIQLGGLLDRVSRRLLHPAAWVCLMFTLFGLLMTTSRGGWLAVAAASGLWLIGRLAGAVAGRWPERAGGTFGAKGWAMLAVMLVGLIGYGLALNTTDWLGAVPGGAAVGSRSDLYCKAFWLGMDYSVTGLGLGSFEMVYSTYGLLTHVGFIPHAHHWLLQVWLEQGLLGVIGLGGVLIGSLWLAFAGPEDERNWLRTGAGWSLVVVILHGLTDAPLYGSRVTPLFLIPTGVLAGVATGRRSTRWAGWTRRRLAIPCLLIVGALAVLMARPALATLHANLGAVAMTKEELSVYSWPEWPIQDAVRREVELDDAVSHLKRSLSIDGANRTANQRLGIIALAKADYEQALEFLQRADREGIDGGAATQWLGEAYLVNGHLDDAMELWRSVDNGQGQLANRLFWYRYIGDEQRAFWAEEVIDRLSTPGS